MVDIIEPAIMVLNVIKEIYTIAEKVKSFKSSSETLQGRIAKLTPAIKKLATSENKEMNQKSLKKAAVEGLLVLVEKIKNFLASLTHDSFFKKFVNANKIGKRFDEYSEQLDNLLNDFQFLSLVQIEEASFNRIKQDEEDRKEDLKYFLQNTQRLEGLESGQQQIIDEIRKTSEKSEHNFYPGQDGRPKEIDVHKLENKRTLSLDERFIYKASYMKETVVLKVYEKGSNLNEGRLFREIKNLIRLDSKNVVRIWGVCSTSIEPMIIMEYMERGNLRHVLDTTDPSMLPFHRRIQMALDGALGLYRIHNMDRAMVHRDLASHRFLVNAKWEVKISGLKMAKAYVSVWGSEIEKQRRRRMCYISPERTGHGLRDIDAPMEVYSYGIIMWEIATGLRPYEGKDCKEIEKFVRKKKKLPFPSTVTNEGLKELIDNCRSFRPLDRPTSSEIVDTLQGLRSAIEKSSGVPWQ
ncbi:mixed lineage kinase domain-like protein [Asterias rubens]|uniref:mixed lineage kinase domain-like protein n=1 Tax=Asterias rubens TaxID=7604 RepID=UPI0014559163|nr:mixed lineage kinase domain-like protein [Asterias rubens]XP_033633277.1 mixed lineage kinase domain-like protein [Asterias rubens]XP_033633278.1 mixed lineage kinase domain-like protein [Asterias rubens]XP_033633279.1 mixed lineage kinase domain-like protein [Asterias rubens]